MRISDWSSDVCSSDLFCVPTGRNPSPAAAKFGCASLSLAALSQRRGAHHCIENRGKRHAYWGCGAGWRARGGESLVKAGDGGRRCDRRPAGAQRSEEHTSELQALMRHSYAVFCLKKKKEN